MSDLALRQFKEDMAQAADFLRIQLDAAHELREPLQGGLVSDILISHLSAVQAIYAAYAAKRGGVFIFSRDDDASANGIRPRPGNGPVSA